MSLIYFGIGVVIVAIWVSLALLARRRRNEAIGGSGPTAISDEESDKEAHRMHLIEEEVRIREQLESEKQEARLARFEGRDR